MTGSYRPDAFFSAFRERGVQRDTPVKDDQTFSIAGLWERWEGEGDQVINSCAILTTEANEVLRPMHDRMPVILHPEDYEL